MSYFDKKRNYTEMFSKTEYLRGYLEEKVDVLVSVRITHFRLSF